MNPKFVITILSLIFSTALFSQTILEKADKEYELFAFSKAIKSYLEGIKSENHDGKALAQLADSYRNLNDFENASSWYSKAVQKQNVPDGQILNYGKTLMALKKYDEASQWFSVYIGTDRAVAERYIKNCSFAKKQIQKLSSYAVSPFYQNSKGSDFGPTLYNENQLFFSSSRGAVGSNWEGGTPNMVYTSKVNAEGQASSIAPLHSKLTKAINEGPITFSSSRSMVAFTKNNFEPGKRQVPGSGQSLNIFIAETDSKKDWNRSKAFVRNKADYNTGYPSFSPDGKTLYFASDRPGGFGGFDIYSVKRLGRSWSQPENLGPKINTPGNEISPFYNGNDLMFASDWHPGFGGFDIFRAEMVGRQWDKIFHLGTNINTSYDDYGFVFSTKKNLGYFVSNRPGGKGAEDIYVTSQLGTRISLIVSSESTSQPLSGVTVDATKCIGQTLTSNGLGQVNFEMLGNSECLVTFRKEGYLSETVDVGVLSGKREFKVALKEAGDIYMGVLYNANSSKPIRSAKIKVTNQRSGKTETIKTDIAGNYAVALSAQTSYLFRYSKAGYINVNQMVKTGDGEEKDIIKPVAMTPTGLDTPPIASSSPSRSTTTPTTTTSSSGRTTRSSSGTPSTRSSSSTSTTRTTTSGTVASSTPTTRTTTFTPTTSTTSGTRTTAPTTRTTTSGTVASSTPTTRTTTSTPSSTRSTTSGTVATPPSTSGAVVTTTSPITTSVPFESDVIEIETTSSSTAGTSTSNTNTSSSTSTPPFSSEDKVVTTTEPTSSTTKSESDERTVSNVVNEAEEGFSIQIMSLSKNSTVVVGELKEKLEDYGEIFYVEENGYKKIRVGSFKSKKAASKASKKIRRKGFKEAFVVSRYVEKEEDASETGATSISTTPSTATVVPSEFSYDSQYNVRLAAYKDVKWFDSSIVERIGKINQLSNGDFTIMYISGFKSLEEAKLGQEKAKASGFNGAYVFEYLGGTMKRVN